MQKKLLFDLVEDLAGEGNGRIVEILYNKKDVNEFSISKKMELTVNQVRNILYKLSNFGLVSFIRKKDNRKGWYIYYWTLNTEKSLALIESYLQKKTNKLEESLMKRENDKYYVCPSCGVEVTEVVALEQDFVCDECAEIYKLSDNSPFVRDLKSKITRNVKLLEQIKEELGNVRVKKKAKREREAKKAEKEKEAEKAAKRVTNKKIRDAAKKNFPVKKSSPKKVNSKKSKVSVKKLASKKSSPKKTVKESPLKKSSKKKVISKKSSIKKFIKKSPAKSLKKNLQKKTKKK